MFLNSNSQLMKILDVLYYLFLILVPDNMTYE
jgi:hypothetical protein